MTFNLLPPDLLESPPLLTIQVEKLIWKKLPTPDRFILSKILVNLENKIHFHNI